MKISALFAVAASCLLIGCSSDEELTLQSSCAEYFSLGTEARHSAAQRLSITAQAEGAGSVFWGPTVDAACGADPEASVGEAFALPAPAPEEEERDSEAAPTPDGVDEPVGDTLEPAIDQIALARLEQTVAAGTKLTGPDNGCSLFAPRDYLEVFGELPDDVTVGPKDCNYIFRNDGEVSSFVVKRCPLSGLGSNPSPFLAVEEAQRWTEGDRFFGTGVQVTDDCVVSVLALTSTDDADVAEALRIALSNFNA